MKGLTMRHFLAVALAAALVLSFAVPVAAIQPVSVAASIALNGTGPFAVGDQVTFTVTVPRLKGSEYLLVYVECRQSIYVVSAEVNLPDATFTLNPLRVPAVCIGYLLAQGQQGRTLLAQSNSFSVQ